MKTELIPSRKRLDRGDLFWLAYLVFFFIEPLVRRSVVYWVECAGIVAIFVAIYIGFLRFRRFPVRVLCLASMYVLGIVTFPFNSGAIGFFIYAAALLPFLIRSIRPVVICFVIESATIVLEAWRLHLNPYNATLGVFFIAVVGVSNIFFAQKRRADSRLRMAHEEIETLAAMAERERIARDLHDVLGHTLSVIVLKAELAGRLLARDGEHARAAAEIADVEQAARTALADVRETIGGYRARGFAAEMEAARNALTAAGVSFEIEGLPIDACLRPGEETVLGLALREAVTNIVRHAQASTCRLKFAATDGRRSLLIEDNGRHAVQKEGNGLRGMRERVESLGGTLLLERDNGTRLLIELPAGSGSAS